MKSNHVLITSVNSDGFSYFWTCQVWSTAYRKSKLELVTKHSVNAGSLPKIQLLQSQVMFEHLFLQEWLSILYKPSVMHHNNFPVGGMKWRGSFGMSSKLINIFPVPGPLESWNHRHLVQVSKKPTKSNRFLVSGEEFHVFFKVYLALI